MVRPLTWWAFGLCVLVTATNRLEGPPRPDTIPSDAWQYLQIADAAPALSQEPLSYHHVQRLTVPYALGLLHDVTGVSLHGLFRAGVLLAALTILLVLAGTLRVLQVTDRQTAVVLAIVALNPWAFRFYLTFPEMITDLGFALGAAILLRGLVTGSVAAVLAGQVVASLSRQTALALVPIVVLWIWHDRARWNGAHRIGLGLGTATIALGVFAGTGTIASTVSSDNTNLQHITSLLTWVQTQFDFPTLVAFAGRMLLTPFGILACLLALAGARRNAGPASESVPMLVLAAVCISLQPVFAGPELTAGNGPRLLVLSLPPLSLALGIMLRDAEAFGDPLGWTRLRLIILLLAVGSLHHWYVLAAEPMLVHKLFFGAAYACAGAGCWLLLAREQPHGAPLPITLP